MNNLINRVALTLASRNEARRLIQQGDVAVNGVTMTDEHYVINADDSITIGRKHPIEISKKPMTREDWAEVEALQHGIERAFHNKALNDAIETYHLIEEAKQLGLI